MPKDACAVTEVIKGVTARVAVRSVHGAKTEVG